MRKRSTLLLAASIAALTLALAAGVASANRLSVDDQDFAIDYGELQYVGGFGGETTVICDVELAGSFSARTFTKTVGTRIGSITSASASSCDGGDWTYLDETLPWSVTYKSFSGTLPAISGLEVLFIGYSFEIEAPAFTCLLRTTVEEPVGEIFNLGRGGVVTALSTTPDYQIDGSGEFNCPFIEMFFAGTGAVEDGGSGSIAFTLI